MGYIVINIVTPEGMDLEDNKIPDSYVTEQIISALLDKLALSRLDDENRFIDYTLVDEDRKLMLERGVSLKDSGVKNGDTLKLKASLPVISRPPADLLENSASPPTRQQSSSSNNEADTLEVNIRVEDLTKSERTNLSINTPVIKLLEQLVVKYKLATKDQLGDIKYEMKSKALGATLSYQKTLKESDVPRLDTLTITREWSAGYL